MSLKSQALLPERDDREAEAIRRREQALDDALEGTFPASDPPAALTPHSPRR